MRRRTPLPADVIINNIAAAMTISPTKEGRKQ